MTVTIAGLIIHPSPFVFYNYSPWSFFVFYCWLWFAGCLPTCRYPGRVFCLHSRHPSRFWGQIIKHKMIKHPMSLQTSFCGTVCIHSEGGCLSGWVHAGDVRWHWLDGWTHRDWVDASTRAGQHSLFMLACYEYNIQLDNVNCANMSLNPYEIENIGRKKLWSILFWKILSEIFVVGNFDGNFWWNFCGE